MIEKINESKEKLKINIQKIFTKLRNTINDREDKLLLEIDNKYDNFFFKENIIKISEKLANKIKESLEKGKLLDKEWINEKSKLNSLINDCLNIENNIKTINYINKNMEKFNSNNLKIHFSPENKEEINKLIEDIKCFGKISYNNYFKFKKCPIDISEERKYLVSGNCENILTKTGTDYFWVGAICQNALENSGENKWKIKVLKMKYNRIIVGVAPSDFDINASSFMDCDWYLNCKNSELYSGPPHNYGQKGKKIGKKVIEIEYETKSYDIITIMNIDKGTIKFIVNGEDKGEVYTNIPTDKPLYPAVFLFHKDDSVEISNY